MMKDDDFKLLRGFDQGQTDRITDICECRVAFTTDTPPRPRYRLILNRFSVNYCKHIRNIQLKVEGVCIGCATLICLNIQYALSRICNKKK